MGIKKHTGFYGIVGEYRRPLEVLKVGFLV